MTPLTGPPWSGWRPTGSKSPWVSPQHPSVCWLSAPPPACVPGASGPYSWRPMASLRSCSWPPSWPPPPSDRLWAASAAPAGTTRMRTPGPMTLAFWAGHPVMVRTPLPPTARPPSRPSDPGHQTPGGEPEESGPSGAGTGTAPPPN